MRTATRPPGEALDFKPGDLVDFYRPPKSKDVSGWHGPASVVRSTPARGQLTIKWRGEDITCRFGDVRRFIDFGALVFATGNFDSNPVQEVLETLTTYLSSLPDRRLVTLGYYIHNGCWHPTAETRKRPKVTFAMDYAVRNILCLHEVYAARVGHGVSRFPADETAHRSLVVLVAP